MDTKIVIGDLIKAFDFQPMEGRKDRYVVGKVKAIGSVTADYQTYEAYTIECVYDSDEGRREGCTILVPVEVFFSEYEGRVSKV